MKNLYRQLTFWYCIFLCSGLVAQIEGRDLQHEDYSFQEWQRNIDKIRLTSPDSAVQLYTQLFEQYLTNGDTLNSVNALVELAVINGHVGHYQSAYDNLWKALLLADAAGDDVARVKTLLVLGRYSSFYKRREEAIAYFKQSVELAKDIVEEDDTYRWLLVQSYYTLASTYRELEEPEIAKVYLDSCLIYWAEDNTEESIYYVKFESAIIKSSEGRQKEALEDLLSLRPWFEQNNPGYLVLIFTYIGDVYVALDNFEQAAQYYERALDYSKKYHSHLDFTPTIHERLADLYIQYGDYKQAAISLDQEKALNMQFFDSRSENNRSLLEIKDEFRRAKEEQAAFVQRQRLAELAQERRVSFWKNTLLLVTIVFLLFAGFMYFNFLRNKHQAEKQLIKKKRELERQQADELLELKNKELATSTLKLIEKDEVLADLKEKITEKKGDVSAHDLKKIVRSISNNSASNWDEFEKRFISVNKGFYQNLNTKYPKLSRGDQKLCALIKLNLSSKEMAKLLGISVESVHTNRYRLRKKLGLTRKTSLTEFVARL